MVFIAFNIRMMAGCLLCVVRRRAAVVCIFGNDQITYHIMLFHLSAHISVLKTLRGKKTQVEKTTRNKNVCELVEPVRNSFFFRIWQAAQRDAHALKT